MRNLLPQLSRANIARTVFRIRLAALLTAVIGLNITNTNGQVPVVSLNGVTSDGTGALIANAKVRITLVNTGWERQTTTNTLGQYEFASLKSPRVLPALRL